MRKSKIIFYETARQIGIKALCMRDLCWSGENYKIVLHGRRIKFMHYAYWEAYNMSQ